MSITAQSVETARPTYEVTAEHLIHPSAEWFGMTGQKAAEKNRNMPSTPRGWVAVVVVPDGVDYICLSDCAAIVDAVRQAGRVVVRGSSPRAIEQLTHELRRVCWSWT